MIDLALAERFVELLTGRPDTPVVAQWFDDSKIRADAKLAGKAVGTVAQLAARLSRVNDLGCGVFVQVNEGGRGASRVTRARALFADDDAVTLAEWQARAQETGQRPECPRCDLIHAGDLPPIITLTPTIVVQSSANEQNAHYYWRLLDGDGFDLPLWSETQAQIACSLRTDSSMKNVDRVMRLPGTMNRKLDPKRGRDGTPFLVRIVASEPSALYTIDDVRAAFPDVIAAGAAGSSDVTISFATGTVKDAEGKSVAVVNALPPLDDMNAPQSADAKATSRRVRAWLQRQQVAYDTKRNKKTPGLFVLKTCVFNPDHLNVMAIGVQPESGAIWGGCFHASCGANRQRWIEIAERIGGWGLATPDGFKLGSQTEVARKLLTDLTSGSGEEIISSDGYMWRYSPISGVWGRVDDDVLSQIIQGYDGRTIGDAGKRLLVAQRDVVGTIRLAMSRVAQPLFFRDRTPGIAFANTFVRADFNGIRAESFSPAHRAQASMPFAYDPMAECPRFEQFLTEVFQPDEDAALKIALLQEFCGAGLLGFATKFESALFLPGTGANGKSRFLQIVKALFPEETVSAVRPQDFGSDYWCARLVGVRLNLVAETPENELLDTAPFKALMSGDKTPARHPSGRAFDFVPIAAHWFVVQALPPTADQSHGFWRKVTVVPFNRTFTIAEQDKNVADYIVTNELPGVAAWAVEGARRLLRQGSYSVAPSVEAAKTAWRRDSDVVMQFIDDCCTRAPDGQLPSLDVETDADDLYQHFRAWCRSTGHTRVLVKATLGKRLAMLGYRARPSNGSRFYSLVVQNRPPSNFYT